MPIFRFILILIIFCAFIPSSAFSKDNGGLMNKEGPIEITADTITYDKESDTYYAKGNVVIVQEGTTLMSNEVMMSQSAGTATAYGEVTIIDEGGATLVGQDLQLDINQKTAIVHKARIFYKAQNIHLTGDPIEKTGPQSYRGRHVTYTTCDCPEGETPAWHFSSTSADVTVGDYLTGWNALFYIKGVPVLYSPYFSVPVKRERQTGLLQPRPGFSKLRGFILHNAFFWAIEKNMDATFYLDIETNRGDGAGAEFRYIRTRKSYGEISFYHFSENDINRVREFRKGVDNLSRPQSASNDRWRFKWQHNEVFWNDINLRINIDQVSDDEYFIDFGKTTQERSLESLESNVSLSKNWDVYSLVAQFRKFNNLLLRDDSSTLQRYPEVTFTGADKKILESPFYFSFESSYVNFFRHVGIEGQRVDLHPRISLPLNPGKYFDFTPSFAPRATFYLVKDDPNGRYFDRYLYEAKADLTTTFVRVFETGLDSVDAIKHTIRPKLTYTYVPEAVQTDLPSFDGIDSIAATSSITYSLNTTLTGRYFELGKKKYIDYLYLDLSQSYNILEATKKLSTPDEKRRPFSEISGEALIKPNLWTSITAKGKYDVYNRWFNSYDVSLSASDKRGDSVSIAQRFVRATSKYLEASLRVRTIPSVDLTYLNRFSFDEHRSLETTYGVEYRHQCWSSVLTYTERLEEKAVYLTFNLLGLGKVAGIQGRIEPM